MDFSCLGLLMRRWDDEGKWPKIPFVAEGPTLGGWVWSDDGISIEEPDRLSPNQSHQWRWLQRECIVGSVRCSRDEGSIEFSPGKLHQQIGVESPRLGYLMDLDRTVP